MGENEIDGVASEIADTVAQVATDLIEDAERRADHADEIIEVLIDAAIETEENRNRREFEERIFAALAETNKGLQECQNNLENLRQEMTVLSSTATSAEAMAETSLILQASSLPSENADDLQEAEIQIDPQSQQPEPETPAPPPTKPKRRLL